MLRKFKSFPCCLSFLSFPSFPSCPSRPSMGWGCLRAAENAWGYPSCPSFPCCLSCPYCPSCPSCPSCPFQSKYASFKFNNDNDWMTCIVGSRDAIASNLKMTFGDWILNQDHALVARNRCTIMESISFWQYVVNTPSIDKRPWVYHSWCYVLLIYKYSLNR